MPIPGLRDKPERFPLIGKIRKGAPKTKDGHVGRDLTYFRYVPVEGEEGAAAKFAEVYGDEPREVVIFLPFDDIERNFKTAMEQHTAGALQCKGDIEGSGVIMWRDKSGKMRHEHKPCPDPPCKGCKECGHLRAIIPALIRYAWVSVETTSIWDIIELYGNLQAIRKIEGRLNNIPLVLKRRPREVSTPRKNGKRARQTKWLLSLEVAPRYVQEKLEALQNGEAPPPRLAEGANVLTGEVVEEMEAEEEAPPPFAEDGGPAEEPETEGPESPVSWKAFAADAVSELGYMNTKHIIDMLKLGGFYPVSDVAGNCNFDRAEGWRYLKGEIE